MEDEITIECIKSPVLKEVVIGIEDELLKDFYLQFFHLHERAVNNNDVDGAKLRLALELFCNILLMEVCHDAKKYYKTNRQNGSLQLRLQKFAVDKEKKFVPTKDFRAFKVRSELEEETKGAIDRIKATICFEKDENSTSLMAVFFDNASGFYSRLSSLIHGTKQDTRPPFRRNTNCFEYFLTIKKGRDLLKQDLNGRLNYLPFPDGVLCVEEQLEWDNSKVELNDLVKGFSRDGGRRFVLLAPSSVSRNLSMALARIPWNMIIDFDPATDEEGHLRNVFEKCKPEDRATLVLEESNEVEGKGQSVTYWIRANGYLPPGSDRPSRPCYEQSEASSWIKGYLERLVKPKLDSLCKIGGYGELCVIDVFNENSRFTRPLFNRLKESSQLVVLSRDGQKFNDDFFDECSAPHSLLTIDEATLITYLQNVDIPYREENINIGSLDKEKIAEYREVGLEFVPPPSSTMLESNISGFYQGERITWEELDNNIDVERENYKSYRSLVEKKVRSKETFVSYISHAPCSGATTFVRRLGIDMMRSNYGQRCLFVYIDEIKNLESVARRIQELYNSENVMLIIVIERTIAENIFEYLYQNVRKSDCRVSFIVLTHKKSGNKNKDKNWKEDKEQQNPVIPDRLLGEEKRKFAQKYKRLEVDNEVDWNRLQYVYDYPLVLKHKNLKALNVKEYLRECVKLLSYDKQDLLKRILSYLAFASKYTENRDGWVSSVLFESELENSFLNYYDGLSINDKEILCRVIEFEQSKDSSRTNRIKPRFSLFCDGLMEIEDCKTRSDLAVSYLDLFFKNTPEDNYDSCIYPVFFGKVNYEEDYESMNEREKFWTKLSPLFNDIKDIDSVTYVFEQIEEKLRDDSRFIMAYAQFKYNKAYFVDGEKHDCVAYEEAERMLVTLNEKVKDATIEQLLGVLNYRRLGSVRNDKDCEKLLPQAKGYRDLVRFHCDAAIEMDPSDAHGYVTKAQALQSYLKMIENRDADWEYDQDSIDVRTDFEMTLDDLMKLSPLEAKTKEENILKSQCDKLEEFRQRLIGNCGEYFFDFYRGKLERSNLNPKLQCLYSDRLYRGCVSTSLNKIRGNINKLKDCQLDYIEEKLKLNISYGNFNAYEKVFLMHVFTERDKGNILREIDWLNTWKSKDSRNSSQLWASYYITCLNAVRVLLKETSEKLKNDVRDGFADVAKKAGELPYVTIKPYLYFREGTGLDCLVENTERASYVEGIVNQVNYPKITTGKVLLDCGLSATFAADERYSRSDEGKTRIRAKIGFRFGGLGLYDLTRLDELDNSEELSQAKFLSDYSGQSKRHENEYDNIRRKEQSEQECVIDRDCVFSESKEGPQKFQTRDLKGVFEKNKNQITMPGKKGKYYKIKDRKQIRDKDIYDGCDVLFDIDEENLYTSSGEVNREVLYTPLNIRFAENDDI